MSSVLHCRRINRVEAMAQSLRLAVAAKVEQMASAMPQLAMDPVGVVQAAVSRCLHPKEAPVHLAS